MGIGRFVTYEELQTAVVTIKRLIDGKSSAGMKVTREKITQVGHKLEEGRAVRLSSEGLYVYADATSEESARVAGIVSDVVNDNEFYLVLSGVWEGDAVNGSGTAGDILWLSETPTAGVITTIRPINIESFRRPVGVLIETAAKMYVFPASWGEEGIRDRAIYVSSSDPTSDDGEVGDLWVKTS